MRIYTKKKNLNYLQYKPNIEKYEINITKDKRFRSSDGCNVIRVEVRGLMLRPLRFKMGMLRPLRPKSGMLRPLRLKMGMLRPLRLKMGMLRPLRPKLGMLQPLRLCATEEILCDFARPKEDMLRLCATQIRYVATIVHRGGFRKGGTPPPPSEIRPSADPKGPPLLLFKKFGPPTLKFCKGAFGANIY